MQTNPLNCIETSLGNLYGSDPQGIRNVAQKIRNGLGSQGFVVVKTTQVDRLHFLLTSVRDENSDAFDEVFEILEGWK
jgi:hypothetical protein